MHVCHFITTLERGGAQSLVRDIIKHDDSGIIHSVCHFGDDTALESELVEAGADVVRVGGPSYSDIPRIVRNLKLYLQQQEADVLHTHLIHATVLGRVAGTLGGVGGIVSSIHNVSRNFSLAERYSELATRPLDSLTIAVSAAVADSFDGYGHWVTVPNGIPTAEFNREVSNADTSEVPVSLLSDGITFLNVARYVPEKNQRLLIRAMETIVEEQRSSTLLIVGRGPEQTSLTSLVERKGLENNVFVTGEVPAIYPYFRAADYFVLPSEHEGLPITLLESLAAGVPVIASDIPGTRQVVRDGSNGFVVDPLTSQEFARVMGSVPVDSSEMSGRAVEIARNEYDISVTVKKYRELYRRVQAD